MRQILKLSKVRKNCSIVVGSLVFSFCLNKLCIKNSESLIYLNVK